MPKDLTEEERSDVEFYLNTMSDVEICKAADQGDPPADHIFHTIWDEDKRKKVVAQVDKEWKRQWS